MNKKYGYQKMNEKNVKLGYFVPYAIDCESVKNFVLRASSGAIQQKNDSKYELAAFQVSFHACRKW